MSLDKSIKPFKPFKPFKERTSFTRKQLHLMGYNFIFF